MELKEEIYRIIEKEHEDVRFKYFVVFDTDDYEQKTNELAKIIEGLANERTV